MTVYHFVHCIPYQCFQEKKRQKKQVQGNEKTIAFSYTGRQEILLSLVKYLTPQDLSNHGQIQRGDRGVRTPSLKNHKTIGFLSNIGPDPLKITNQASIHCWTIIGTPAKRRSHLNGVSLGTPKTCFLTTIMLFSPCPFR